MTRQSAIILDRRSEVPLHCQLAAAFRDAILSGMLRSGERILSSRELQVHLGISRTTALNALNQLQAEGYIETVRSSGTFVCRVRQTWVEAGDASEHESDLVPTEAAARFLSARTAIQPVDELAPVLKGAIPFCPGLPALERFPAQFRRTLNALNWAEELLADPHSTNERLRNALVRRLQQTRGVVCSPDQVLIVPSLEYAVSLITRVLVAPFDSVVFEEPGCPIARSILIALGVRLILAPIDDQGLVVASFAKRSAALAFVTPSHEYPMGAVLSRERRVALLEWASACNAWIVENDYESEFNYIGRSEPALQGLDEGRRVLYMGTFCKILSPSIRIAFIIAPRALHRTLEAAHHMTGGYASPILQTALATFMEEGHLARHVTKVRRIYDARRRFVSSALSDAGLRVRDWGTGLHFVAELPKDLPDVEVSARAADRGIVAPAISAYFHGRPTLNGLILGFAASPIPVAKAAVQTLLESIRFKSN